MAEKLEEIVTAAVENVMRSFSWDTLEGPENLRARLSICAREAAWRAQHNITATPDRSDDALAEENRREALEHADELETVADQVRDEGWPTWADTMEHAAAFLRSIASASLKGDGL